MLDNILVCSDGSASALQAAGWAVLLAGAFRSRLQLLSVYDNWPAMAGGLGMSETGLDPVTIDHLQQEYHQSIEASTLPVLQASGQPVVAMREIGNAVDRIVAVSEDRRPDLLVLGSRGLTTWEAILLGSVAGGVLHRAVVPVLIARGEPTSIDRLLVATDGSEASSHAAAFGLGLATALKARVVALNVLDNQPSLTASAIPANKAREDGASRLEDITLDMETQFAGQKVDWTVEQVTGHPAQQIVEYAQEEQIPLIVMGSRGLGAFRSALLGSVSDRVANHAHCSVLVVR